MFCSISGNSPEEPVISIKSGYIYEKRLIEKYIESNGKEPVTGEPLNINELVPVKVGKFVKPRPTNATSIPAMLQMFQNEWDSLMLETFTLRQQYETIRQELAHSIYQYDAACRVIARLMKERDLLKNEFMNARLNGNSNSSNSSGNNNNNNSKHQGQDIIMEDSSTENKPLPKEVQLKIQSTSEPLIKARKQRSKPDNLPSVEDIKQYKPVQDLTPHSGKALTSIDNNQNLLVTAGDDLSIQLFDVTSKKTNVKIQNAHSKRINQVLFHPQDASQVFSCSQDKVVKVWSTTKPNEPLYQFDEHTDSVTGISLHASGDYLVSSSLDKSWKVYDVNAGKTLSSIRDTKSKLFANHSIQFAPDGLILALGQNKKISVWEINSLNNAASLEGHQGDVISLSFSENGYYLASADQHTVKLWDLRKLKVMQDIQLPESSQVKSVAFDYSGSYLSIVGTSVNIYDIHGKTNPIHFIQSFNHNNDIVSDSVWSKNSSFFATTSFDSTLKIWAKSH